MRVFVVDDDPNIIRLAVARLTRSGFEVESASDGAEALVKIQANPPEVLVCDIMMPVMGGFELCNILGDDERFSNVKVVYLGSCAAEGYDRVPFETIPIGSLVNVSLVKPFNPLELVFAVNELAGIKQPEWMPEWLKSLRLPAHAEPR